MPGELFAIGIVVLFVYLIASGGGSDSDGGGDTSGDGRTNNVGTDRRQVDGHDFDTDTSSLDRYKPEE